MQKTEQKNVNNITFSIDFIKDFRNLLKDFYNYGEYMDFLIIPSLVSGKKTLRYLSLLSYTDRDINNIEDLKELSKDTDFQIRVLDFNSNELQDGDTVTMRLDIKDKSSEQILSDMKSKYRKIIKNSIRKNNFIFKYGRDKNMIEDFYKIFSYVMKKHGTPALDKKLFFLFTEKLQERVIFYNCYDEEKIISAYCVFLDEKIAYGSWGGTLDSYRDKLLGHFSYWSIIKHLCSYKNIEIFDFGRSPYNSGGYIFKHRFGAYPIKIETISSEQKDIYSKYSFASNIWKKLPKNITDFIGPKLCKYLVDL